MNKIDKIIDEEYVRLVAFMQKHHNFMYWMAAIIPGRKRFIKFSCN